MEFNFFGGIIGFVIFCLDVWAIASIINTNEETGKKILWILLVAVLPVVGLVIWWLAGPKANYNR